MKKRTKHKKMEHLLLKAVRSFLCERGVEISKVMKDENEFVELLEKFTGEGDKFLCLKTRFLSAVNKLIVEKKLFLDGRCIKSVESLKHWRTQQPKVVVALKKDKIKGFYLTYEWRKLRYQTILKYGRKCMNCGTESGSFHVDHIKPIRKYWDLRLNSNNLQVLCEECNHGKGNWDETDHRPPAMRI